MEVRVRALYSTDQAEPIARKTAWQRIVSETYFPLDLRFPGGADFSGALEAWSLGTVSMSRNRSDGLLYRRHERHLLNEKEESFLITVPEAGEIRFEQDGKDVRCRPGAFLVERSHLPYEFSYRDPAALWVLKIPSTVLRARIGRPERLATLQFDATRSVGALFVDMLRMTAARLDEMNDPARALLGGQLVDLLAMAVEADDQVLSPASSSVRNAHLNRAEHFIRERLHDPHLAPAAVAAGCGISLRYLHQLFEDQAATVCGFVRDQRLLMCDAALRNPACNKTISAVAYEWGFNDQAQFSRAYRARFGRTPSETRKAAAATD